MSGTRGPVAPDVVRHDGAAAFLARAEPWLMEREDRNNLVLSLAYAKAAAADHGTDTLFATVEGGGGVVGCVIRTPPYKVLLTAMPLEAAGAVSACLAEAYESLPAVLGPEPVAEAVAAAWVAVRGGRHRRGMRQRMYRLDRVLPPAGVEGRLRRAVLDDLELAVEWSRGFARDVGSLFAASPRAIAAWIEHGQLFFWENGQAVSTAVAHGRTPNGVRVGYVYTPAEHRGRGHASALVADLSGRMLDGGARFCVLYTDLANPTSNAIYQRVGYSPLEDVRDIDIVTESAP
jgi:GNAT superfamily N-acetyltransferase